MNDSVQSSCPKCGASIAGDAPQGLCPKCVLGQAATEIDPGAGPSKRTPPPTVAEVAAHFPELEIEELIGAGGMGAVYKARQPQLDRVVALKVLAHELSDDPAFLERFNREGRVLARLSHPNIVAVYDTGTAGPFAFLLMEYVDGVNLRQAMRTGRFTPVEALTLVEEICAALKFAHGEGILHRDIKPENILIDSRGQVKIADFGIAKLVDQDGSADLTLTLEGSILGSPHYMAPEQIETPGDVDQRADIYSLGVVFYEMLTGELPMGRFALPSEKSPIDARIDEIVLRTLAKEREARFQSAGEVRTEVEAITRSGLATPQPPTAESSSSISGTARFATVSTILAGTCLLLCAWPYFLWKDSEGAVHTVGEWTTLIVVAVLPPLIAGILAIVFGRKALRAIRRSGGGLEGRVRSLVGVSTLPLILAGLLAAVLITDYRPSLSIMRKIDFSDLTWRKGEPEIDLDITVAPGLVVTYELVRTDAAGKEETLEDFQGFILAADSLPWRGAVRIGSIEEKVDSDSAAMVSPGGSRQMVSKIEPTEKSDSRGSVPYAAFARAWSLQLDDAWGFEERGPVILDFSAPEERRLDVATRGDLSQTLSLRVEARPRAVPGVPAAALDHAKLPTAVCGLGGDIEWIRYLMENMERSLQASGAPRPPREPEPEWREGSPESHVNLTIDPGLVAEIELTVSDENGAKKVYHRGYIVASDLEPWEGKLRVGSLAGSSDIQWRIDGPFNTAKADIDPGWSWRVEPMATNSSVTKAGLTFIVAGTVRSAESPPSKVGSVSFVLKTVERRRVKAELPGVLACHLMGLGEDADWIEGVRRIIEMTGGLEAGERH